MECVSWLLLIPQVLLYHYVRLEGQMLSQMIRKSIETRDWLSSHEPRHVRGAIRRVVEEISIIDKHLGKLYEEGQKKEISGEGKGGRACLRVMRVGA